MKRNESRKLFTLRESRRPTWILRPWKLVKLGSCWLLLAAAGWSLLLLAAFCCEFGRIDKDHPKKVRKGVENNINITSKLCQNDIEIAPLWISVTLGRSRWPSSFFLTFCWCYCGVHFGPPGIPNWVEKSIKQKYEKGCWTSLKFMIK